MNQGFEVCERAFITHHQTTIVLKPGIGAFDDPTVLVASQFTTVLMRRYAVVASGWNDGFNTSLHQLLACRVAVVGAVGDQALRLALQLGLVQFLQSRFQQGYFRRGRRVHVNSERSTLAIGQYHELCSLATLGFTDRVAPFLATTNVPSTKHSFQRIMPCSSNWVRKARHKLSKVSSAAHSVSRRCTVLGLPYCSGNSLQGAPVHKIHKIPSKHRRLSARGRPPLAPTGFSGRCGSIAVHCFVVNCFQAIGLAPQLGIYQP